MGSLRAEEMANAVDEGLLSLRAALSYHLSANHFPPIDPDFVPTAEEAIIFANANEWNHVIRMPNGLERRVAQIVEGMHLEAFLQGEDDDA